MLKRLHRKEILLAFIAISLVSCVGIDAGVEFRSDLSGNVTLEYRISRMVESMGKMDGNEAWLPLPVGRGDFERTVARVRGLALTSFSSKETETDVVVSAVLAFTEPSALVAFLDATGRAASFKSEGGRHTLSLRLAEGGGPLDPDLERLVRTVFSGYDIKIDVKTPSALSSSEPGTAAADGRTASYRAAVADLLASTEPRSWELSWGE